MRKWWHFLWILWLLLAIVNLLFVNVYITHFGRSTDGATALGVTQQIGYLCLSAGLLLLSGIWLGFVGLGDKRPKGITAIGIILSVIAILAIAAVLVLGFALDGKYIDKAVGQLAEWFSFIKF